MTFNLATILRESAASAPDRVLLHFGERAVTYSEVDADTDRVCASLLALGLEPGDKVAVQLPNVVEFVLAYFGCMKAGLVMVPLNPLLTAREVGYHLQDSDARLIVTLDLFAEGALNAARSVGVPAYVVGQNVPAEAHRFAELLEAEGDRDHLHPCAPDDTAVLLYTSGTTGQPKGAELTHFQLFMNCTVAGEIFGFREGDVAIGILPLFHVFGLSSVLNMTVRFGGTLVLTPRFDPVETVDLIERHRVTVVSGVPTMFMALLQTDTTGRDLSSLRSVVSGGASIPGEVVRAFEDKFKGVLILEGYGLSETASTSTFNFSAEERKVLSVGKPIWGVELKLVDHEGKALPAGPENVGEILIRGHNVMKGYYKRPEATAAALQNGWLHTGDLGYRDEEGYLFIVDRLKDLVIRGGYNVYPREVEEVLYAHPAVAEAAVVGRADDRLGEEVVAYVSLKPGASATSEELKEYCRENLAAYKYPREIHVLEQLPKGPTGKILKTSLRRGEEAGTAAQK
jgi:long-chain acyl-CoA synthetase